jgi:hypothetical protein
MWRGDTSPIYGKHFTLAEPLSSPPPLRQPRPRILIGGGGEKKTLRLVARYADACNLFARLPTWQLQRKLAILRRHCEAEGRAYDEIEKTTLADLNPLRQSPQTIVDQLGKLGELGFQTVIASLREVETLRPLELMGRDVIPQVESR